MADGSATKSRRVQLACRTCRVRKTRCDGRQPVCEACEARGATCVFEPISRRRKQPGHSHAALNQSLQPNAAEAEPISRINLLPERFVSFPNRPPNCCTGDSLCMKSAIGPQEAEMLTKYFAGTVVP